MDYLRDVCHLITILANMAQINFYDTLSSPNIPRAHKHFARDADHSTSQLSRYTQVVDKVAFL